MNTKVDGEGPFGGSGAQKVWRSFLTNQYAQLYAKSGGVGIAKHVYDELLKLQGVKA
jgi:Rod binding domain-containing protein